MAPPPIASSPPPSTSRVPTYSFGYRKTLSKGRLILNGLNWIHISDDPCWARRAAGLQAMQEGNERTSAEKTWRGWMAAWEVG
ncbi:hypothetical protein VTL71DRAFT_6556, partial [Oculimacula yallundae]